MRRKTRQIRTGNVVIGSDFPVTVQSMVNVRSDDFTRIVMQIKELEKAGCDIVRLAVPDEESADVISIAKKQGVKVPLVADVHFDYKLALKALEHGADKIRINPGNIGADWKIREVVDACSGAGIPIRIGVNSGSVEKRLLEKYGAPTSEALAESALSEAEKFEKFGFSDIILSIKSSSVPVMIDAVERIARECDYPLHIGSTEAGGLFDGTVRNCVGIGSLLSRGIGDTLRVSLTADPVEEVRVGRAILETLGISEKGSINVISCPTCGRTRIDIEKLTEKYREMTKEIDPEGKKLTVAIMGCAVNGPGEAREADFGIAGGDGYALFFRNGEPVMKVGEDRIVELLVEETKKFLAG